MNDRQISKLFWAVKATLVAVLLYVAVEAVITPFQLDTGLKPKAVAGDERPQDEAATRAQPQTPPDYTVILDNNVFTGSEKPAESNELPAQSAVASTMPSAEKLGLKLLGVLAASPATSRAIIEDAATKAASPYRIGDTVASATIESIEPDRVILLHNGRRRLLQLHLGTASTNSPSPSVQKDAKTAISKPPSADAYPPQPSARLGYVEEIFRKATIQPYVKDGRTEGLKITGIEQTPLTKFFGLRDGDIVQTVNGQNLNSKQKAFQVLKKARTQPKINLQLLRDGKPKELSFDL